MPDWQELVRQRLSGLTLEVAEKDDVHAELAGHLEDSYDAFCNEGLPEKESVHRAMELASDWADLQHRILASKRGDLMQKRVHQLWIPAFLTLTLSMAFLMMVQKLGFRPLIVWSDSTAILFYVPWLASLPFFGALGAYLASRAGGSRAFALFASVFPVFALSMTFLLMFPIGMMIERLTGNHMDFGFAATVLLKQGLGWIVVPGAALLAGGLLIRLLFSHRSSQKVV